MKHSPDPPSRGDWELTPLAQKDLDDWQRSFGSSGCSCYVVSPPCASCTHPGNPYNLEASDDAWMEIHG